MNPSPDLKAASALIAQTGHLHLPFFSADHQTLANELSAWCAKQQVDESDDRRACQEWVRLLGDAGWLRYCVPDQFGGALPAMDSRALDRKSVV